MRLCCNFAKLKTRIASLLQKTKVKPNLPLFESYWDGKREKYTEATIKTSAWFVDTFH